MAIRLLCQEAEKFLGQPVVVVNKVGGSTTIGTAFLASSKPDGYTIGFAAHSGLFVVPFMQKLSYHPVQDLTPILQWAGLNIGIAVRGDSPFKSLKDLIEYARQNPKTVTYGTDGPTSIQHIIVQQIGNREKVELTHIPVHGPAELQAALLKGGIVFGVGIYPASAIESGQIRFLVLLRDEPSVEYPNIPILKDLGYEIPCPITLNIFGPKGINPRIAEKLEDAFTKAMKEPGFIDGMKKLRIPIVYRNSKALGEYVARSFEVYSKFLKEMGLAK
jgi:tripartite-type tricarboxylate transporter receptor subunit TctC